jgi:hypothetical protein
MEDQEVLESPEPAPVAGNEGGAGADSQLEAEVEAPKKRGGGPRTAQGRERSKRNGLTHGLMAKEVFPPTLAEAVEAARAAARERFQPRSEFEELLVRDLGRLLAQLEHCGELIVIDLQRQIDRAAFDWQSERRQYINDLGARLKRDPKRVKEALERTRQGAEYLISHWEDLREAVLTKGGCTERQRRLAFDLLGVPLELRDGSRKVPEATDAAGLLALIERELTRLRERLEGWLNELDEATRLMVTAGMPWEEDDATKRLRKYQATLIRERNHTLAQLRLSQTSSAEGKDKDASSASSGPAPTPAPTPRPPQSKAAQDFLFNQYKQYFGDLEAQTQFLDEKPDLPETDAAGEPLLDTDEAPPEAPASSPADAPAPAPTPAPAAASKPGPCRARPSLAQMVMGDHRSGRQRRAEEKRKAREEARHKGRR